MNRPGAEKLLGGFAAGILTDAEKRALFTEALERQDLFDALADEEALRELLADPAARERLLAALSRPEGAGRRPRLWRRPAFIGLAASLFALVTTTLIVLRRPEAPVFQSMPAAPGAARTPEEPAGTRLAGKAEAGPPPAAPRKSAAVPESRIQGPAGGAREMPPVAPPPEAEPSRTVPLPSRSLDLSPLPEFAEAVPLEAPAPRMAAKRAAAQAVATPPVDVQLEHLPGNRIRLKVTWAQAGYLYVLARAAAGTQLLAPTGSLPDRAGMRTAFFEWTPTGVEAVDVYVLREPAGDPASLPGEGPVAGERRRVYPD